MGKYECPYKPKQRCHTDCLAYVDNEEFSPRERCMRLMGDASLYFAGTHDGEAIRVEVQQCQ